MGAGIFALMAGKQKIGHEQDVHATMGWTLHGDRIANSTYCLPE